MPQAARRPVPAPMAAPRPAPRPALVAALVAALSLLAGAAGAKPPQAAPEPPAPPLRAGVQPRLPPFIVQDRQGRLGGFTVDLFEAIAARLKRKLIVTAAPAAELLPGLVQGRFDVLPGPLRATPEHAGDLLYLEGYMWTEFQFGTAANWQLTGPEGLRGKRLAVDDGSDYAEWALRNAPRYGFTVVQLADDAAVFDAIRHGRADATLTGSPALRAALAGRPPLAEGPALPETRSQETAAVREDATELRDELEDALVCLKQDGTVARLSAKWFAAKPDAEDLENLVMPGYGVPGLAGYDPKPRAPACGR